MKKFLIIVFVLIFCLSGCSNESELTIENKIESEIEYVKKHSSSFVNDFEGAEYLKDGAIDWEKINYDTTVFLNSIPTIKEDLKFVKLSDEVINTIDSVTKNINNYSQNKQLENLKNEYNNLYNLFESLEK